jgi:hypothetical protein
MKSPILIPLFLVALFSLEAAEQVAKLPPGAGSAGSLDQATPAGQSSATGFTTNKTQPMLQFDIQTTNQFGRLTNQFGIGTNNAGPGTSQFGFGANPVAFDTNFLTVNTNALGSIAPGNSILLNGSGQFDISANGGPFLLTNRSGFTTSLEPTGFTNFPNRIFPNTTNMLQLNTNQ